MSKKSLNTEVVLINDKALLSVNEVAKILGISRNLTYGLIKQGYLKAMNMRGLKVTAEQIQIFLKKYSDFDFTEDLSLSNKKNISDISNEDESKEG